MEAVIYVKAWKRMCKTFSACDKCLLHVKDGCMAEIPEEAEMAVSTVEQWAKENPIRTRQSEFLRLFPNTVLLGDVIDIDPCRVEKEMKRYCGDMDCNDCKKSYWNEEVDK